MSQIYSNLHEEYNSTYGGDYSKILTLMREITGSTMCKDFDKIMGDNYEKYKELEKSMGEVDFGLYRKHEDLYYELNKENIDWESNSEELRRMIETKKRNCSIANEMIIIIEKRIKEIKESKRGKGDMNLIKEIENKVKDLNNLELVNKRNVTKIWSDGEITSEKGGEIYGMRTIHSTYPSLNIDNLNFPNEGPNGFTFAIVKHREAVDIRKMMEKIYS